MGTIEERIALADKYKSEAIIQILSGMIPQKYDEGFSAHKNKTEKILRDLKNKYKSWLSEEKVTKLAKTPNYIKQVTLQSKIELIEEIERKLCIRQ